MTVTIEVRGNVRNLPVQLQSIVQAGEAVKNGRWTNYLVRCESSEAAAQIDSELRQHKCWSVFIGDDADDIEEGIHPGYAHIARHIEANDNYTCELYIASALERLVERFPGAAREIQDIENQWRRLRGNGGAAAARYYGKVRSRLMEIQKGE